MNFADFQENARNIASNPSASLADYLSCASHFSEKSKELPWYGRELRIAILCGFTIQGLAEVFRVEAALHNILAHTYETPYKQFTQEALNNSSRLYEFNPQLIYLIAEDKDFLGEKHRDSVIGALHKNSSARIVLFNFDDKNNERHSADNRIIPFSFSQFISHIGKEQYWNTKYVEMGDMRLAPTAYPALAHALAPYAVASAGATKKCLAVDLDNTLWEGIVGEDGFTNIKPRLDIQKRILELYHQGVILAINSRNNLEEAMAAIERHPDMILHKKHFAAHRINWQSKEKNMEELAKELNLGTESFVLIDDDPFQQSIVRAAFPEIAVIPPEALMDYSGFYKFNITEEDKARGALYESENLRKRFQKSFQNAEEFLQALELRLSIQEANDANIPRISQLSLKTNQFNVATRRYNESEIKERLSNGWKIFVAKVTDKFGDYGITGVCMMEPAGTNWRIDNFLLSCRVLGRKVEQAFLGIMVEKAKRAGAARIIGEFIPTAKNKPSETFFKDANFSYTKSEGASQFYEFPLNEKMYKMPDYVKVV